MNIKWKSPKGYKGLYLVSTNGQVKSLARAKPMPRGGGIHYKQERILKAIPGSHGYLGLSLCKNGKVSSFLIHRLMAEMFLPNPKDKREVNHKDGNKLNNRIENLEWVTKLENMQHASRNGLVAHGEMKTRQAKLTDQKVLEILRRIAVGEKQYRIAQSIGVSQAIVSEVKHGKKWKHVQSPFRKH